MAKSRRRQQRPTSGAARRNEGQVGRRPSRPGFLLLVAALWIAAGVIELFVLDASWRFVPAIFFFGIGLFFLRAASVTMARRERPHPPR